MRVENHFRVKSENIGQPEVIFRKISFSVTAKHASLGENDLLNHFHQEIIFPQNKRTLSYTHFMNVLLLNSPTFSNIERSWSYNILISTTLILAVKNYINLSSLI